MAIGDLGRVLDPIMGSEQTPLLQRRELLKTATLISAGAIAGVSGDVVGRARDSAEYQKRYFIYEPGNKEHSEAIRKAVGDIDAIRATIEETGRTLSTEDIISRVIEQFSLHTSAPPLLVTAKDSKSLINMLELGAAGVASGIVRQTATTQPELFSRRALLTTLGTRMCLITAAAGAGILGTVGAAIGKGQEQERNWGDYVVFDPSDKSHVEALKQSLAAVDDVRQQSKLSGEYLSTGKITQLFFSEMSHRVPVSAVKLGRTNQSALTAVSWMAGGVAVGFIANQLMFSSPEKSSDASVHSR